MRPGKRPLLFFAASLTLPALLSACGSSLQLDQLPEAPPVAPPGTSGSGSSPSPLDSEEAAFVGLINAYRQQNGLLTLQLSATLTAADQWLSQDMANNNYLDHTDSLGRDFVTRLADFGYSANSMGENIAAGNSSAQATFTQWRNSPPHNANMLDSSYTALGVGRAFNGSSSYGWYWATDFGSTVDATVPLAAPRDQKK